MLENSLKQISEKIASENSCQEIDWTNYEFGKNFYENVKRDESDTSIETDFIINKLRLKPNSNILDLGCGDGRNAFTLAEKGFNVTGVDLNLYSIEQANKNKSANTEFIHQDILDINFNEQFNAVIMIFNHFSNFNIFQAISLLKKIEKSLVKDGKVLIEISSENFLESLDNTQEWHFTDSWLSGQFQQLVLIENIYEKKSKAHIRKDHCIKLDDLSYSGYLQRSFAYSPEKINEMLKQSNLKLIQIYGDWSGKMFEDGDDYMIITAQK